MLQSFFIVCSPLLHVYDITYIYHRNRMCPTIRNHNTTRQPVGVSILKKIKILITNVINCTLSVLSVCGKPEARLNQAEIIRIFLADIILKILSPAKFLSRMSPPNCSPRLSHSLGFEIYFLSARAIYVTISLTLSLRHILKIQVYKSIIYRAISRLIRHT